MNRTSLPINEIKVENRQRLDLGDLQDLANSIKTIGLIQPIVVNQEKRLIAGGRRLAATCLLGHTTIDVVWRETLTEDELHVMELEENIRRKDETWQEKALHIQKIHQLKTKLKALDSESWGQRETGAMLGTSIGHINYCLTIASQLRKEIGQDNKPIEGARYWGCDSLSDAWRLWIRDKEDSLSAELSHRSAEATKNGQVIVDTEKQSLLAANSEEDHKRDIDERLRTILDQDGYEKYVIEVSETPYLLARVKEHFIAGGNKEEDFELYWSEKLKEATSEKVVYLSNTLFNCDSIEFMNRLENKGRFDHIITDIPYGIDMVMLNQQNPHGSMVDIDTVEELHDVEYNKKLIADFFPAAFACTKPSAFVVTWCDQMLWQFMYDCAIKAGFAVQRWPITWNKTSACMNQCAGFNTTKDTEIAIVCRKKGATLAKQPNTSVITCGRDDLCSDVGHPFAKPFEVWKFLVEIVSIEGQEILEPFMGRGSGVISMLQLNRKVVGVELDQAHFNAGLENVKTLHYLKLNPNFVFK